jgi:hypothetical protein
MPWDVLAARIAGLTSANVLTGPTAQVEPDAIVVRPDEPWMEATGAGYRTRPERYGALAASRVADPASSLAALYGMALACLLAASDEGWDWVSVSGVGLDETTGIPLLVVEVHCTFKAPTKEV